MRRYPDTGDAVVPCEGCTACCRGEPAIPVFDHELYDPDGPSGFIPESDTEVRGEGEVRLRFLRHRENGDCVYLTAKGCAIWGNQPEVCRKFDCRRMAELTLEGFDLYPSAEVLAAGLERMDSLHPGC